MSKNMTLEEVKQKAIDAALEAAKTNSADEREGIFRAQFADAEHNSKEAKQKVGNFFKALANGNEKELSKFEEEVVAERKDLSVGTDADGGYLVPVEFRAQMIEKLYKQPVIRSRATVIPMSSDTMDIPVEGTAASTNWTAELATITQSDPTFGEVNLATNYLFGLTRMSRKLLRDAAINVNLVDWIVSSLAGVIGRAEDTAFMAGSGSGQPKGIRQETFTTHAQAGAAVAGDDFIDLFHTLPIQYRENAVWLMHDDIAKAARKLKDSDGQYLWVDTFGRGLTDTPQSTLLGRPVLIQNDIPTNLGGGTDESEVFFGDLSYYVVGDREAFFSEVSTQEGTSFEKHRAALKVGERLDGKVALTEAIVEMTGVK